MTTARATTNENGYMLYGANAIGRPISSSQMYSDKTKSETVWKYKDKDMLDVLRYSEDRSVSIGAMRLIQDFEANKLSICFVYKSVSPRHVAVHCPDLKKVVIVMEKGNYVVRPDKYFTGRKDK
jgi:hypothetical protein|tara:strand:+ start:1825 stop:2196 length:372 start_codon:yes stop_codon:yes gene_type:complete